MQRLFTQGRMCGGRGAPLRSHFSLPCAPLLVLPCADFALRIQDEALACRDASDSLDGDADSAEDVETSVSESTFFS